MRYLVTTKKYKLRKAIDNLLNKIFPKSWIPLYTMVTFSRIRYSDVVEKRSKQDKVNNENIFFLIYMKISNSICNKH
jgi:kynurenine 3-monooxygenase